MEDDSLQELYREASPSNTSTTELLARNIVSLRIVALPIHTSPPELLELTLSAINARSAHLIAKEPKAVERNARLLRERAQWSTGIIHLPSSRDVIPLP